MSKRQTSKSDSDDAEVSTTHDPLESFNVADELALYQAELNWMHRHLEKKGIPMVVLVEGRDASGKGGLIRTITEFMNDKHFKIVALGKPSESEKTRWYYQRFTHDLPRGGQITFYNGSWYGRGLSEPAFGFCTQEQYQVFMDGVDDFEKDLVSGGIILVKIYLSITKEEQRARYQKRKEDPRRSWKLSEKDSQKLRKWDELTALKLEVMKRSGMERRTRWNVIRSGDHKTAVKNAIITILNSVEYPRHYKELNYVPDDGIVISGVTEAEAMEAALLRKASQSKKQKTSKKRSESKK